MEKVSIVGVDISKRVFQLHGSTASGRPVFVKKLSRGGFLPFLEGSAAVPGRDGGLRRRPPLGPADH